MPWPVRAALVLLWSALAVAVGASLAYYASLPAFPPLADVAGHLLGYGLLAMLLLGMGARNAWARRLFAVYLVWNLGLLAFNLLLRSGQLPWLHALDALILALQLAAGWLLLRPSSRAWFDA